MLFVEIPTNPDMKVPDYEKLAHACKEYKNKVKDVKDIIILVDSTFAPASTPCARIKQHESDLTTLNFISMSKSVSRGLCCAGTIIAGPTANAEMWGKEIRDVSEWLDT